MALVDVAIVNEVESRVLGGIEPHDGAARRLLELGTGAVIVTLGAAGALVVTHDAVRPVPAPTVPVVDTAGAGDVFCGVFAAALARGCSLADAVPLAVAAASLAVTRRGTSSAFPSAAELAALQGSRVAHRSSHRRGRSGDVCLSSAMTEQDLEGSRKSSDHP